MNKTQFKETEIGKIPEDWKINPSEKFCFRVTDGTHDSPKKQASGKYLITSRHLMDGHLDFNNAYFISEEDCIEANKRSKVDQWDVIFSMIGTIGESYLEKGDVINYAIKNVGLFKSGGNRNKGKWIFYYTKSRLAQEYIHRSRAGTTQEYMTLESLRKFPILFPTNEIEMNWIIQILDSLQDKIELNHRMNKTLEAIGQAIFKHWFIDFEFPDEKGKPYKSSGGEMVDSELGEIPKGCEIERLSYVLLELESGSRPKGGVSSHSEGVPSIGAENIFGLGEYDYSKTKFVPLEFFGQMNSGVVRSGDVLLYKDGAQLGRKSMFMDGFPYDRCCVNEHVFILRTNEQCCPIYLYFWLDQPWMTDEIRNLNTNSAQPGINKTGVLSLKILIPPKDIIKDI